MKQASWDWKWIKRTQIWIQEQQNNMDQELDLSGAGYSGNKATAKGPELWYGVEPDVWAYIYILLFLLCLILLAMFCAKILIREQATIWLHPRMRHYMTIQDTIGPYPRHNRTISMTQYDHIQDTIGPYPRHTRTISKTQHNHIQDTIRPYLRHNRIISKNDPKHDIRK